MTTWSKQQNDIFDWFKTGKGNLVVRARAGTGKTTVIIEGVTYAPERKILLAAFNKKIATELDSRLEHPGAEAKTLHSLGFGFVRSHLGKVAIDSKGERATDIARIACATHNSMQCEAPNDVIRDVCKLASLLKAVSPMIGSGDGIDGKEIDFAMDTAVRYDIVLDEESEEDGFTEEWLATCAIKMLVIGATHRDGKIDFDDMIWLPVRNRWARPRYDLVIIDECFPGDTPILLADMSTRTIKEICESKEEVLVLSYDEKTGKQVAKKVIARNTIPLRKKTIRIKIQQVGYGKTGEKLALSTSRVRYGQRTLVCTINHRLWTERGWIESKELVCGDVVQVESLAPRDSSYNQKYKHSEEGKRSLAEKLATRTMPKSRPRKTPAVLDGGNGRPMPLPQQLLLDELGDDWIPEFVVKTGPDRPHGAPYHYKIDIANPACKIAIEIDGESHRAKDRQDQDARKDSFLASKGWTIHRFSNKETVRNTSDIASRMRGCPTEAVVVAVEEHDIDDQVVYDLTVDGTHNYYAHGILVHNCQDMNRSQIDLAQMVCKKNGRIAVIGDEKQAIYGFRGADSKSVDRLKKALDAAELGLTTTYRCAKSIVREARILVPDFHAFKGNSEGRVEKGNIGLCIDRAEPGDFILSRTNAPLVSACLKLLREGKRANIEGKDVGAGLKAIIRRINKGPVRKSFDAFDNALTRWHKVETERAVARGERGLVAVERIADQYETLLSLMDGLDSADAMIDRIEMLFDDTKENKGLKIILSSVHRSKGLEADRVWLLRDTFFSLSAKPPKWVDMSEERNIQYVAVTRAKLLLTWVEGTL